MANAFFWYDLMTTDTRAAADFYGQVVGWTTQDQSQPGMQYTIFMKDGASVAGLMPVPAEMKGEAHPVWMGYIAVDDVEATVEQLKGKGGVLHRGPIEVSGIIRFAVVADPQGAVFLVATPLDPRPMPKLQVGTPGTIGWHELYVPDWNVDWSFYEAMFGWTKAQAFDMGDMGSYQLFGTGGEPVGGMMNRPAGMPMTYWAYYFNVDAIDAAAERVRKAGGSIRMGPAEVPGGQSILQATDPQGAHFALLAPRL